MDYVRIWSNLTWWNYMQEDGTEERRRQALCDKRDNNFVWNSFSPVFTFF